MISLSIDQKLSNLREMKEILEKKQNNVSKQISDIDKKIVNLQQKKAMGKQ
jgi:chaperonin cofactor prefoldin